MNNYDVILLTGSPLALNPRVIKEATTLANAGYRVNVLGAWTSSAAKSRDLDILPSLPFTFTPVLDCEAEPAAWWKARARRRLAVLANQVVGLQRREQLGYATARLRRACNIAPGTLHIAHSEPALAVVCDVAKHGGLIGVDFEDWFSQDLPDEERSSRPVRLLRNLEQTALEHARHASCTSQAMSRALAEKFQCPEPTVLYNCFPLEERRSLDGQIRDRRNTALPSIHWFSQTMGPSRGLEDLIAALPFLRTKVELHLRGEPYAGFDLWLKDRVPDNWRDTLFLHPLVPHAQLLSRIAEHDIGFAGENPNTRNRDLTVSNKILQYLLAGLAVVASNTAGQHEVALQAPGAVFLYPSGDARALAKCLNGLLLNPPALAQTKHHALEAATRVFCWERQEGKLLRSVEHALSNSARAATT